VKPVTPFRHESLKQLTDQQVRFAPRDKKLQQAARAEKLLTESALLAMAGGVVGTAAGVFPAL
jgi:hypothetical protein